MYTDIHSHILPGVDDGPKNYEEAFELLKLSALDGVKNIIATPHFYASLHVLEEQLQLVSSTFEEFANRVKDEFPQINFYLGVEVRYFDGISRCDSLELLCIKNTRTLLLELGYEPITDKIVSEITELYYNGFNVILAHLERYYKIKGFSKLKSLLENGFAKAQLTSSSFLERRISRVAVKLLKGGYIHFIASDMHSADTRPPKLKEAFTFIENTFGKELSEELIQNSFELIESMSK